jgi:hypothetical protein
METAMDVIPPELMAQIAERDQDEAADCSASRVIAVIRAQQPFAITPEWFAQIAAALSERAKALREEPREIAQNYLDDLVDDMRGCV